MRVKEILIVSAVAATVYLASAPAVHANLPFNGNNPPDIWDTMSEIPPLSIAAFPGANAAQAAKSAGQLGDFPRQGSSFQVFSTGAATLADEAGTATTTGTEYGTSSANPSAALDPGSAAAVYDMTGLDSQFVVPLKADCLSFDFVFLTDETSGSNQYRDGFYAQVTSNTTMSDLTTAQTATFSQSDAAGTTYDSATSRIRAQAPVVPGSTSAMSLRLWDATDDALDSAVFVDRIILDKNPNCGSGFGPPVPTTEITQGPPKTTAKRKARFEFESPSDPESSFECSLDGAQFKSCEAPLATKRLRKGKHAFEVRAVLDEWVDDSAAKTSWKIK